MATTLTYVQHLGTLINQTVTLHGWVVSKRSSGKIAFIEFRDGSGFLQCIVDLQRAGETNLELAEKLTMESAVIITGQIVANERQENGLEMLVDDMQLVHLADEYPIARKEHGVDFLINNRHLWLRTKRQWAVLRVRNQVKMSIMQFFYDRGFIQADAPLLTGNACEGTTNLFETDYYEKNKAYLSQSGQLYGEAIAMAHGKIYTFGPTFRAEKSATPRHLSEFWMIEPEMAFYDLEMDMNLIEEFVKHVVNDVAKKCAFELQVLERDMKLFEHINQPFPRITYMEAAQIIKGQKTVNGKTSIAAFEEDLARTHTEIATTKNELSEAEAKIATPGIKKGELNYFKNKIDKLKVRLKKLEEDDAVNIPIWIESAKSFPVGDDFGSAHERAITRLFNCPVFVYKWPAEIKAFYMKRFEDDPDYVKGVDLLAPDGFGEIVGGSEREYDHNTLLAGIKKHNLPEEAFTWYLDLRKFGSVPHAGFGLGFERMVMWLTGVPHIRETIPFPRYYGRLFP
ncbi:MAG: asparagine--tRNA ligase [Sphingobacteriales bacterium]|jgi:asparaginyl-tRNA synthetase|nr:asparagine--tRNA ligase [Sphingobacteriales bacterium]MBP9140440.1 asparagine--tRNA ligase [Chitinophagales bacterium]MDA0197460.1 asparagine--tRNA ligase [Bacteroidota bacterium]MBK6891299.1 asparagine--tRNA ligase [Sphingobacteriales bacterium]MBK7526871.1 asparagine--tRNA ligase [Sphingobacteriales bacterium]